MPAKRHSSDRKRPSSFTCAMPSIARMPLSKPRFARERKQENWMKTIYDRPNAGRVDNVIAEVKAPRRLEAVAT